MDDKHELFTAREFYANFELLYNEETFFKA